MRGFVAVAVRVALAALAAALVLAGSSVGEAAGAEVPPELASLEQQTAKLQANSERFTLEEEVSLGESGDSAIPFALVIAGRGEVSDTPAAAWVEAGLLGSTSVRERVVGETEWVYDARAKELDGGRPWVRRKHQPPKASDGLGLGLLETPQPGSQGTFGKLIEELNGAQTLVDSGPVTVDDERVMEFDASVNPAPLIARLETEARAKEPQDQLDSLFPELPGAGPKGPPKTFPAPTFEIEAFIAPNGLPVRLRGTFTYQGEAISVRVDTLAINIPVSVSPPPARQTVGAAKLKVLERRAAAIARRRLLRACKRLKGKIARECRASANGGGQASSPPSLL